MLCLLALVGLLSACGQPRDGEDDPATAGTDCIPTEGTPLPEGEGTPPDTSAPVSEEQTSDLFERLASLFQADPEEAEEAPEEDIIWEADLESRDLFSAYSDGVEEGDGSEADIDATNAPEADGKAVRMTMPPARGMDENVPNRKFLDVPGYTFRSGDEAWYGVRLWFDENWQLSDISDDRDQFTSLISFRYQDGSRNGTGSIKVVETQSGTPCLVHTRAALSTDEYESGGEDPIYLGPVVEEQWIDLVCHFKWSHTEENALKECWRDGDLMGRSTRPNMTIDAPAGHRIGIYEGPGVDHERTLYWDNHRIGRSYEAVDPSR